MILASWGLVQQSDGPVGGITKSFKLKEGVFSTTQDIDGLDFDSKVSALLLDDLKDVNFKVDDEINL